MTKLCDFPHPIYDLKKKLLLNRKYPFQDYNSQIRYNMYVQNGWKILSFGAAHNLYNPYKRVPQDQLLLLNVTELNSLTKYIENEDLESSSNPI